MRRPQDDEGASLVELLVAISLFALIGTITLNAVVTGLRSQTKLTDRSTALAELRTTAQRLSRDVRQADPVLLAQDRTLVLRKLPAAGGSQELTLSLQGSELVQSLVGRSAAGVVSAPQRTVLLRGVDPAAVLFGYVKRTSFTSGTGVDPDTCAFTGTSPVRYSPDCIGGVTLRLTHTVPQLRTLTLDQTVELRNAS